MHAFKSLENPEHDHLQGKKDNVDNLAITKQVFYRNSRPLEAIANDKGLLLEKFAERSTISASQANINIQSASMSK